MKNKNKIFIFGVTTISAIAVCASLVTTNKFGFNTNADDQYSFTFGLLTESTTECDGTYVGRTALGNTVKVDYTQVRKYGSNDYAYHNTGSSWEINKDTQLGSITSLVFDNVETSGSLTISCGWDVNGETGKVDYLVTLNKSCSRGSSATYDLSEYDLTGYVEAPKESAMVRELGPIYMDDNTDTSHYEYYMEIKDDPEFQKNLRVAIDGDVYIDKCNSVAISRHIVVYGNFARHLLVKDVKNA